MKKCVLFIEKLFVLKYCLIMIVLGRDSSTPGSMAGPHRCDRGVTRGRGFTVHSEHKGN